MSRERLEAFSDGVIAIAITLLVLDIKVPDPEAGGAGLGRRLAEQWPSYAAYVVSFLTIGVVWVNHHAMLRRVRSVTHRVLVGNLILLLVVAVLPWTTALCAAYVTDPRDAGLAGVLYAGSFLVLTAVFYALQHHLLFHRDRLLLAEVSDQTRRRLDRRARLGLLPYAVAVLVAPFSAYASLALCGVVAIYYALPGTSDEGRPTEASQPSETHVS